MESLISSKTVTELRSALKELNIKVKRGCKKVDLIKSISKYVRKTYKYKPVLVDILNLDVSNYLEKKKNIFINKPARRNEIKKIFDSFNKKFYDNDFKNKENKKIRTEVNLKHFFIPDYELVQIKGQYIKKYKVHRKLYKIKQFNEIRPEQYYNILKDLFRKAIGNIDGKVDIIIHNPLLDKPFHPKLMSTKEAFGDYLEILNNKIEYKELDITQCLFDFNVIELPKGGKHVKIVNDETISKKMSIIQIKNDDNICLARSIITALSKQNPDLLSDKLNYKKLTKNDVIYIHKGRKLQKILSEKLHELCDIPLEICNLEHVKKFENFLDIQIIILCRENFNEKIYNGTYKSTCIYILKNRNHFDVITTIKGFLGKRNFCDYCQVSYDKKDMHKCELKCDRCFVDNSNCEGEEVFCNKCFRQFKGNTCLDNHNKKSVCERLWKCLKCKRNISRKERTPENHKCGESKCKNCRNWVMNDHKCFMKTISAKGGRCIFACSSENDRCYACKKNPLCMYGCLNTCIYLKKRDKQRFEKERNNKLCFQCITYTEKYIFFDLETNQETGIHEVNLVISHDYKGKENIFSNENEFCEWLFSLDKEKKAIHRNFTVLAHYGKGFDFQFLAKYCFKNKIKVFTIYQGNKLIYMEATDFDIRFIDSINFTLIPLRDFPRTFNLKEMSKGHFPHLWNTAENQNYVGKIPDKYYYGYNSMTLKNREKFDKWYETVKNDTFDFQKEFVKYCRSDVDILRKGCLELRRLFLKTCNIDPFRYVTLAGVCMTIYRSEFLIRNTIAIDEDITQKDQYSKKSIVWLDYLSKQNNINIQHALNGGEKKLKLGGKFYKVDGYYENTVYQFQGCHWHGCKKCYRDSTINTQNNICMKDLYDKTQKINNKIIDAGYKLIEIWECDFNNDKSIKKSIKDEWKRDFIEPLNPRDAFYGGRCEPNKLKYEMKNNEKGRYIDVCSLYPTVNYFDFYPKGHPIKILNPVKYDENWYGLIKCKILPPRKLYHPVLPYKEEKLIFSLCKSCSKTKQCKHFSNSMEKKKCKECYEERNKKCNHSDVERNFIGTWTTDEVKLAIKKGYEILNIYEVWHFEEKTNELFKDYVKLFLKMKLETDDKLKELKDFKNDKEYKLYVEKYKKTVKDKLNIELDELKKNPGLRFISKICLNSLWGKFGQRKNMPQKKYVMELEDFYEIILDDKIKDLNMIFMNDDCVEMSYKMKDEYAKNNFNTNLYIAAFTTSSARIRLYEMLDQLDEKVMYYDTDSIVYIDDESNTVETGCMLGEWTDELGEEKYIKSWISGASKDYAYILNDKTVKGKVKGFKMSYESETTLNFNERMKIITGETDHLEVETNQFKIQNDRSIKVNKMKKKYMFGFDKRRILEDFNTVPFGY